MSILNTIKKGVRRFGRYVQEQNKIDNDSREYESKKLQQENEDEAAGVYKPAKPMIKKEFKEFAPMKKMKGRGTSTGYMPR